jgi:hypothetical protein
METKSPKLKNRQLESLYLRENDTRILAWKRYHDEIAQQRCNWPPPTNGQTYSKREEAIYSVNTDNFDDTSWFHRHIYENELTKSTRRYHIKYDFDRCLSHKETKLEKEVRELREKLEKLH